MLAPHQKEQLSLVYFRAVCTACGLQVLRYEVDADGVDVAVCSDQGCRPRIDVQLKMRAAKARKKPGVQLSRANFEQLASLTIAPRYLILVSGPADASAWVDMRPTELALAGIAYWTSLRGQSMPDGQANRTITFSDAQRLTVDTLRAMMVAADSRQSIGATP